MKNLFVLVMALVIVFSMGAFAFACGPDCPGCPDCNLCPGSNLDCDMDVSASIKKFAKVECIDDSVDFAAFCPAPGIYIADGDGDHDMGPVMYYFVTAVDESVKDDTGSQYVVAADKIFTDLPGWTGDYGDGHWDGWGATEVTTNCDVDVTLTFAPGSGWLNSDTIFAVNRNWGTDPGYFAYFDELNPCTWTHTYDCSGINGTNPEVYYVDGALKITDPIQNAAGDYSAKIFVTLSVL